MRTNVYVDAFNLYYGCLLNSPYKWINLRKLVEEILPTNAINKVRVFAARVTARNDPDQPARQATYFRALKTIPDLSLHYGQFVEHPIRAKLVIPPTTGSAFVRVWKTEEKGSDVNLATYLLLDAVAGDYEAAVVVSNDSDLCEPILHVRKTFGKKVVVLHPCRPGSNPSFELRKVSSKSVVIPEAALLAAQFPPVLRDSRGEFSKPPSW